MHLLALMTISRSDDPPSFAGWLLVGIWLEPSPLAMTTSFACATESRSPTASLALATRTPTRLHARTPCSYITDFTLGSSLGPPHGLVVLRQPRLAYPMHMAGGLIGGSQNVASNVVLELVAYWKDRWKAGHGSRSS